MEGHAEIHHHQYMETHFTQKSYFLHVEEISSHARTSKPSSLRRCLFSLGKGLWCHANLLGVAKTNKEVALLANEASRGLPLTPKRYG